MTQSQPPQVVPQQGLRHGRRVDAVTLHIFHWLPQPPRIHHLATSLFFANGPADLVTVPVNSGKRIRLELPLNRVYHVTVEKWSGLSVGGRPPRHRRDACSIA